MAHNNAENIRKAKGVKGEGAGGLGHGIRKGVGKVGKLGKKAGEHGLHKK